MKIDSCKGKEEKKKKKVVIPFKEMLKKAYSG